MALTDENGGTSTVMPVQPMGYGGNYGGGYGIPFFPMMGGYGNGFGGDGGWWILLLILAIGNGGWGGFGGFGGFGGGLGIDFPWLLNGQNQINANTNSGFDHAATQSALGNLSTAVTSGFGDVQLGIAGVNQNICQTGNNAVAAVTGAQNALAQQLYSNEIASLNRSFAEQTANAQGFNAAQRQLSDCCCENRLATANLSALVQSENCADREALSGAEYRLTTLVSNGIQSIKDQLCQDKIDAKNERIVSLENQVNMMGIARDATANTARLLADNAAQTQAIENYVRPQINPSYIVPNPYAYNFYPYNGWGNGNGCGCGNNGFGFAG